MGKNTNTILKEMLANCKAECAFLLTRPGKIMTICGASEAFNLEDLVTKLTGFFSLSSEVTQVLGETDMTNVLLQTENMSLQAFYINRSVILITLYSDDLQTGLIRVRSKQAVKELIEILPDEKELNLHPEKQEKSLMSLSKFTLTLLNEAITTGNRIGQ